MGSGVHGGRGRPERFGPGGVKSTAQLCQKSRMFDISTFYLTARSIIEHYMRRLVADRRVWKRMLHEQTTWPV